jgi:hypothetical protein
MDRILGREVAMAEVEERLTANFKDVFDYNIAENALANEDAVLAQHL